MDSLSVVSKFIDLLDKHRGGVGFTVGFVIGLLILGGVLWASAKPYVELPERVNELETEVVETHDIADENREHYEQIERNQRIIICSLGNGQVDDRWLEFSCEELGL